jgi:hypothetical protein
MDEWGLEHDKSEMEEKDMQSSLILSSVGGLK